MSKKPKIIRCYLGYKEKLDQLSFEYDPQGLRPSWIHIKDPKFKARFFSIMTKTDSEVLYKRFTGNFYYPVDLKINEKEIKRFYQKFASVYDQNTARNNQPMAEFLLTKIKKLKVSRKAKVLDLGAGTGIFSDLASQNGSTDLTLLDNSEAMLDIARTKSSLERAKFILGDIREQKFNQTFDLIVSIMMFDVIDDRELPKILENLKKHLEKGGYILLIEDKQRAVYKKYFRTIEEGIFYISKKDNFTKYCFIGGKTD
ncbi:MAG TPA: class I SAM-dependent methyltransferase [Candidatus Bathyarchaeia archaeon]|nr:class I SAM-dependent methyltransferase [Candidatus Bathyarchaeia archaeon]